MKKILGSFRILSKIRGDIPKSRCTTSVNDTGGKFATGVNDTGGKIATGIYDTGGELATGKMKPNDIKIASPSLYLFLLLSGAYNLTIRFSK
jgi:hypothetical protein